jgi:hypothetical protein
MAYKRGIELEKMPKDQEALELYIQFAANTFRMMALLAIEEIERNGQVHDKASLRTIYRESNMEEFSQKHEPASVAESTSKIIDRFEKAVDAACDRRPLKYKETLFPGHCDYK